MDREVKYRARRLNDFKEEREFVYGQYQKHNLWDGTPANHVKHAIHYLSLNISPKCNGHILNKMEYVSERTLGVYSTYNDVDDIEIYEGDIVEDNYGRSLEIVWYKGRLQFKALTKTNFIYADMEEWFEEGIKLGVKIVGNIYGVEELNKAEPSENEDEFVKELIKEGIAEVWEVKERGETKYCFDMEYGDRKMWKNISKKNLEKIKEHMGGDNK